MKQDGSFRVFFSQEQNIMQYPNLYKIILLDICPIYELVKISILKGTWSRFELKILICFFSILSFTFKLKFGFRMSNFKRYAKLIIPCYVNKVRAMFLFMLVVQSLKVYLNQDCFMYLLTMNIIKNIISYISFRFKCDSFYPAT